MNQSSDTNDDVQSTTIEAGDTIYSEDIEDWEEMFSADADRFGNIRHVLYEMPAGTYVHVNYRPGESVQLDDGTVTQAYSVNQVGEAISTDIHGIDEDVQCAEFLVGDWTVYDARWSNTHVSISTEMTAWPNDEMEAVREAADEYDLTFDIALE